MSRFFAIYDGEDEHRYQVADLPLLIGSDRSCHIRLAEGKGIEAQINLHEGKYLYLKPVAEDGKIFHNDQLITDSAWIKSGDQTRIGDWVIQYRISGDRVEIIKSRYTVPTPTNGLTPPEQKSAIPEASSLPHIATTPAKQQGRLKRNIAAGIVFLFLVLAALFVLTAHTLEIEIDPEPDSLAVQGSLPLVHAGNRFLGVAGSYSLQASKDGYEDLQAEVIISTDQPARYSFTLKKLPGLLTVNSSSAGVDVLLDGKIIGKTPLKDTEVSGGSHMLTCRANRYKDFKKNIEISSGQQQTVDCLMEPSWGRVFVVSSPAEAQIYEGDKQLGKTPLTVELDSGEHTLIIKEKGFTDTSLTVQVKAGETLTPAVVTLAHKALSLRLSSSPKGAAVYEGNTQLGKTPFQISWQQGSSHKLKFSLKGYETVTTNVTVKKKSGQKVTVSLQPILSSIEIEVTPPAARLYIDGRKQKKNSGLFKLSTRSHKIEARAKGYRSEQQRVTPNRKKTRKLFFALDQEKSAPAKNTATSKPAPKSAAVPVPTPALQKISKPQMVSLGPGTFTMGASRREPGRRANEGQHGVTLSRPFLLSIHEVTNAEFHRFQPGHKAGNIGGQSLDTDNLPVVKVSWQDAARYCNWLSRMEGLQPFYKEQGARLVPIKPATKGYRLPFEAEWEFAARKVARTRPGSYPWDGKFPPKRHHGNYADESARTLIPVVIKGYYDGFPVLAPVANFPRNMAGLFDMGGNVSEWCHDFYSPIVAPISGKAVDPVGPETGKHHVYRGSSWRDGAITELRVSYRGYANNPKDSLGFRVARFSQ